ncbi:MAG: hypothetical protein F9K29_23585 [Hyphomicrobiaceae bacterium]|nr:MAG: hypothetical protein F9K29_23585 [Hyphomicrobiaceae bacterium]
MVSKYFRYEARHQPLATRGHYLTRLALSFAAAALIVFGSLFAGMLGYAHFEGMSWLDAFLNAAMILSGMGPAELLKTDGGKLFAGIYAMYSGLIVVLTSGIMLAPIAHRILHHFHIEDDKRKR